MENPTLINTQAASQGAIVVGLQLNNDIQQTQEDLEELVALLTTLGIPTKGKVVQKRQKLTPNFLLGSGKVEEISALIQQAGCNLVVIDHALSGPQIANLEKATSCRVLDRSGVILEIFARHAKTKEAKTQVEIAQMEYLLPRLTGAWTHFQKQKGGGVYARGMGEKQIEIDRRRARERIARLKQRLEQIRKDREIQRRSRRNELTVSLVGYTNSGKTTLMGNLTRAETTGKNELFATLDANTRTIDPSTRPKILLSDTVGFIRKLPHSLIESFKSTLEEVLSADLLLHIVDLSHPCYSSQMELTQQVLDEIGAGEIPTILVFNKVDQVEEQFLAKIVQKKYTGSICVSAYHLDDILRLRQHIYDYFETKFVQAHLSIAVDNTAAISFIHRSCVVIHADYETPGSILFEIRAPQQTIAKLDKFIEKPLAAEDPL